MTGAGPSLLQAAPRSDGRTGAHCSAARVRTQYHEFLQNVSSVMRSGAKLIRKSSNNSGALPRIENYVGLRIESNVFSVEPDSYQYPEINPFLPFLDSWPFPLLFVPYLLSVTFRVSISVYEDKLKKMLRQVNELKETYRKHEKPSGSDSLNSLLSLKHELNNLLSDFRQIKSVRKIFKSYFLTNSTICEKSIVVSFNDQTIDYDLVKDKIRVTYIHAINEGFVSLIKNVENHVREIKQDLKFIQERIEFLQQQRLQKNNSRSNRIMLTLTFVIVIFTIVAGISVFDEWFNH